MDVQLLETARNAGGLEGILAVLVWLLLSWVKSSILTKLERLERLCEGLKETDEDHGEKIDMLHDRVLELEEAVRGK